MKATEVTACLVEGNGSLPPGGWLKVTCGLTACTLGSAPGPTLGNVCVITLPLAFTSVDVEIARHASRWLQRLLPPKWKTSHFLIPH